MNKKNKNMLILAKVLYNFGIVYGLLTYEAYRQTCNELYAVLGMLIFGVTYKSMEYTVNDKIKRK